MLIKLAQSPKELLGILELQCANLKANLSPERAAQAGFVTVEHDLGLLQRMNDLLPQVVAIADNQVVGYALAMAPELRNSIQVLKPMFSTLDDIEYRSQPLSEYDYYVMGQVCIAQAQRGQGLFARLYQKHKEQFAGRFDFVLTEVSTSNGRSMRAHEKTGFRTIHSYIDPTDQWNILLWDWT